MSDPVTSFMGFCEGQIEPTLNKTIHTLILSTDDCIVYLDSDLFVEWSMLDSDVGDEAFGAVTNRVAHLETASMALLGPQHMEPFRRLLGEAVARVIEEGDTGNATAILEQAENYMRTRAAERARTWYLSSTFAAATTAALSGMVVWIGRDAVVHNIGEPAFQLLLGAFAGAVGAFLSVFSRAGKIEMNAAAGSQVHHLEGAARVVVGMAGAVLVGLAVQSKLLLGFAETPKGQLSVLLVACMVAGAGERMVPNLIKKLEDSALS